MNNYLPRLLGLALRRMRSSKISSSQASELLQIHDSKYRLIESGGQILDPELVVPLKKIEAFKEIQTDRMALFIAYCYFIQESINRLKRRNQNTIGKGDNDAILKDAINTLIDFDRDTEIFLNTNILIETSVDYDIAVSNLILFLTKKPTTLDDETKISRLRIQLLEIEENTLCVFNPLIKGNINGIDKALSNLANFKNINDQIDDLSQKIHGIKDLKLAFDTVNAPEFIKVHKYQEVKGTISDPENVLDLNIIENYSSYMKQVWLNSFKNKIKFIFLSADEDKITQIVSKYKNDIMYKHIYYPEYNREKGEHFQNGIRKIEFKYINRHAPVVKKMLGSHNEFWFYHSIDNDGSDFKNGIEYGFMTKLIETKNKSEKAVKTTQYKILTNKEVKEANRDFDIVWNAALPII